jgi:hypothetical protein
MAFRNRVWMLPGDLGQARRLKQENRTMRLHNNQENRTMRLYNNQKNRKGQQLLILTKIQTLEGLAT